MFKAIASSGAPRELDERGTPCELDEQSSLIKLVGHTTAAAAHCVQADKSETTESAGTPGQGV